MVSVAVSTLGCTDVHFLEPGVKVNREHYGNTVLCNMLLPDIRRISGDWYIFQQHSAPAHRGFPGKRNARVISPLLWPPVSPDLNPVDYSVWSILQEKVYKTRITDLGDFKHRIRTEWAKLDHAVIAAAVRQWRRGRCLFRALLLILTLCFAVTEAFEVFV